MKKLFSIKTGLIILSLAPLFLLTLIKNFSFSNNLTDDEYILNLIALIICSLLVIVSIFIFCIFRKGHSYGYTEGYTISEITEEKDAGLNFFLTYILPLLIDDLYHWQNFIVFVLILIITILLLSKTDLYYANPVLTILGYRVIKFKFDESPSEELSNEVIGICSMAIKHNKVIKFKTISGNVVCVKQRMNYNNEQR